MKRKIITLVAAFVLVSNIMFANAGNTFCS